MSLKHHHRPSRCAWLALLVAAALASGCAHVQVDAEGRTHVLGLVWLTLPPPAAENQITHAGQGLRLRALGLSMLRTEVGATLVLGWHDSSLAYLLDHKIVDARALFQRAAFSHASSEPANQCPAPTGDPR